MIKLLKTHRWLSAAIAAGVLLLAGLGIYSLATRTPGTLLSGKSPSKQIVSISGASADFGCLLDSDATVTIKKVQPAAIDPAVEIFAYDFRLSSGQPDGFIELAISYPDSGLSEDEEKEAVCGKYYNEQTDKWEDVIYTVDPVSNTVRILTDHLSVYGVFKIVDPTKRSAHIPEVNIYETGMTTKQAQKILESYAARGTGWKEDVAGATIEALGSYPYFAASSAPTLLTLGGAYDSIFSSSFNNSLSILGLTTACAQFAYDAYHNGLTSTETSISGMKTVLDLAVNFASPSIQMAYISVGAIDLALTEVSTFAVANKYRSTKNMYDAYYGRAGIKRNSADWFNLFDQFYQENKNGPRKVLQMMKTELERYVQEYWSVAASDWESWIDAYEKNGKLSKYPWPSEKDRNNISAIHKSELLEYLGNVFKRISLNFYLDSITERQREYQKVADLYNQKFSLKINEKIPSGGKSTWAGCYARLAPLAGETDPASWTGKLDDRGGGTITFTLLAHQIAGFPMKLELYRSAADVKSGLKAHTITLQPFTDKVQSVTLEPWEKGEEPEPDIDEPAEDDNPPPAIKPVRPPQNPWYDLTIVAQDGSKAFRGWYAILQYPKGGSFDLKDMYASFNNNGICTIHFQEADYTALGSPSQIWLYKDVTDLLNGARADQTVNFSLGSASSAGERGGQRLYQLTVKAKPPQDQTDHLESITGLYSSYMIYQEFWTEGLPKAQIENFGPHEKPSGNVDLHYNGPTLTLISKADPYNKPRVLEKLSNSRYELKEGDTLYRIEILTTGASAKLYIYTVREGYIDKSEYILDKFS